MPKAITKRVEVLPARREEDLLLEPFFRSRQLAQEIRRTQPLPEQRWLGIFYQRHGCWHCGTKERLHAAHGLCAKCRRQMLYEKSKIEEEIKAGEV